MPTFGWPEGTTVDPAKLPDWSWRLKPTLDLRPESERPPPGQLRALDPPEPRVQSILVDHTEPGKELMAYATIAARHMDQFDKLRHSRQILFRSNFALVRFERAPDLTAVHEVYTALVRSQRGAWHAAAGVALSRAACFARRSRRGSASRARANATACVLITCDYGRRHPQRRRKTRRSCKRSGA